MIFTIDEIKRLEELASWGISKGIQDKDLKNAVYKLRRLMKIEEDARVYLTDPERASKNDGSYIFTNLVNLCEAYLNRAMSPAESKSLQHLLVQGCSYEEVRFGFDQCISDLGSFQMQYVVELLVKELGIKPDEETKKYMNWNREL